MAITSIGEIGIRIDGQSWFFSPRLRNIEALGSPAHIVQLYALVHSEMTTESFLAAVDVLWGCCEEGDATKITGHTGSREHAWVPGLIPADDVLVLARSLMRHGITGDVDPGRVTGKKSDYTSEFSARDVVSAAIAHLGISERDAWDMTMTSFVSAMRAKFGEAKQTTPTIEEHEKGMDWLEQVNKLRGVK